MTKRIITQAYLDYIWESKHEGLASELYNDPPIMMNDLRNRAVKLRRKYAKQEWHTDDRIVRLQAALTRINRKLGCLSPKVKRTIEKLNQGAVEAAHQSIVLGGPCYILNKAVTAERLARLNSTEESSLVPFYCIADYDIVQSELTHTRTPLMGPSGNIVSIPIPQEYEFSPVSVVPLPEYHWYEEIEQSIRAGYSPLFKVLEGNTRTLFDERLEYALSVTRQAFLNSDTLGEWAQRIIARIVNIVGNLGLPLVPASDDEIRELWALGMEFLLSREIREDFVRIHDEATKKIRNNGFEPGAGGRDTSYVPFFYECQAKSCNRARTELFYELDGSNAILRGECPLCGEEIRLEVDAQSPDLSDHATFLSPRVDSRQFAIDSSIPVIAHAGGPGETAYYSQVIPIARKLEIPFPMFVKYPRVFFNTPWGEDMANQLKRDNIPVLHRGEMFRAMGKITRSRNKENYDEMNEAIQNLAGIIWRTHDDLLDSLHNLENEIEETEEHVEEEKLELKFKIETYLSWAYGRYAKGKNTQESSWSWIEWALNAGLSDLFGPYKRAYMADMKNGATLFVNFMV
ncbi:bacillithiol biosynthesis BshC [Candidatus Thorarchaeota archaeon]|nr:MAG: bacillithiol biosynthesis BshC [Candidatus Thorarchaeota archaeon]